MNMHQLKCKVSFDFRRLTGDSVIFVGGTNFHGLRTCGDLSILIDIYDLPKSVAEYS